MKTVTTLVTDDLDGTPDAETQTIELNGQAVEIDLAEANTDRLHELLEPYFEAGRRVVAKGTKRPGRTPRDNGQGTANGQGTVINLPPGGATQTVIREWWKNNPDDLPTWQAKGRLPSAVMRAWEDRDVVVETPVDEED